MSCLPSSQVRPHNAAAYQHADFVLVSGAEHLLQLFLVGEHALHARQERQARESTACADLTENCNSHAPWTRLSRLWCSAKRCRGPFHWTAQTVNARAAAATACCDAHLVSPRHNSVAIARHLEAQPLCLQPNHCDVGEPLLTCKEQQFQRTRVTKTAGP